jgi:amino acid transporter
MADHRPSDDEFVRRYGYRPRLRRSMGAFSSFAISFSLISITTGIFANYGYGLTTAGPAFIWTWPIVGVGQLLIALVFAEAAGHVPLTGYAYQWGSKLIGPRFGWFPGWLALVQFFTGMTGVAYALASYFAPFAGLGSSLRSVILTTMVILVVWAVINVIGIRLASMVNNASVVTEIVGSVLAAAIILVIALVHPIHPADFIISRGTVPANGYIVALGLSLLVGAYTITGFEGAADLTEETDQAIRRVPRSIILSEVVSAGAGMIVLIGFTLGITHLKATENSPTPLLYIMQQHLGNTLSTVALIMIFISIFACGLVNMAAVTRLIFALARDNMLPFSRALAVVHPRLRSPYVAIAVATVISCLVVLSAKIEVVITSISTVAGFMTYGLVVFAAFQAVKRKAPEGAFTMGRWFKPVAYAALGWIVILICALTIPAANRETAIASVGAIVLGAIWYFLVVRPRVDRGTAGVALAEHAIEPGTDPSVQTGS